MTVEVRASADNMPNGGKVSLGDDVLLIIRRNKDLTYDIRITDSSDSEVLLLSDAEYWEVTGWKDDWDILKFCKDGKWGTMYCDFDPDIIIPARYDGIRITEDTFPLTQGFVLKGNREYFYSAEDDFEFSSPGVFYAFKILDNIDACSGYDVSQFFKFVERIFKYEFNMALTINSEDDLREALLRDETAKYSNKIDTLFTGVSYKDFFACYGQEYAKYDYVAGFLGDSGCKLNDASSRVIAKFEDEFAKLGKKVRFGSAVELKEFILDVQNEKFFIENFQKLTCLMTW